MGQAEVIEFLEQEFYRNSKNKFTKEEIEKSVGKRFNDHSLIALVEYGEIERETKSVHGNQRKYRYRYKPNGPFKIAVFKK